jgi:hypothetical protein
MLSGMRLFAAALLVACAFAAQASAALRQSAPVTTLMPGVTYQRQVTFTPRGPVVLNVVTGPRPGGLYALKPVLSNNALIGRQTLTEMEKGLSTSATAVGVNGDLFTLSTGVPSGVLMRGGVLETPPLAKRSSIGIGVDGLLHVDRIAYSGYWKGTGQRRSLVLNGPPTSQGVTTLYTPAYGPNTPAEPVSVLEETLSPFPVTNPNSDLLGTVTATSSSGGVPIPTGGAVLVSRGGQTTYLSSEAPVGTPVTVRLTLTPNWNGITDAIGGGPLLVRNGKAVFRTNELFATNTLAARGPRTAVGQLADGRIVLVAVDGLRPGYSIGMTSFELALALQHLGAVTASALDSGASTTMAFDGALLNKPSNPGGERSVSDALMLLYTGVYAPPPGAPVLSPNGDGVADVEPLAYKVVRPSTVTASLIGPDGVPRPLDSGPKTPGVYTFTWNALRADGSPEQEGKWRLSVTAVDDQKVTSTVEQPFTVNDTIGFLKAPTAVTVRAAQAALSASFTLARAAQVTATIRTASGIVVATVRAGSLGTGPQTLSWNGRTDDGKLAFPGRYTLVVSAVNDLGRSDLSQVFTARRG